MSPPCVICGGYACLGICSQPQRRTGYLKKGPPMNRLEEIEAAATNETTNPELCADCFKDGAKWADAHPSPEVLALVEALEQSLALLVDYRERKPTRVRYSSGVEANITSALSNYKKSRGEK